MKGSKSENLFMSCMGELVLKSSEFDLLLGQLMPDGSCSPGLVDKFEDLVDAGAIVQLVARDSEEHGLLEDAVSLYDLVNKHERVVELLNTLLGQVLTFSNYCQSIPGEAESRPNRLQRPAVDIARK